ncbi:MAG: class I SAM-dependent methyltransferase, partial [Solirubrobacteraceae bacterium]|nr:class I SAM-dependent methyltransferase [Patulibacter sp.]
ARGAAAPAATPSPAEAATPRRPAANANASTAKRILRRVPGAQRLRARWWQMQDRSVASRTADIRTAVQAVTDRTSDLAHVATALDDERARRDELTQRLTADQAARDKALEERLDGLDRRLAVTAVAEEVRQLVAEARQVTADHLVRHSVEPYGIREAGFAIEDVAGIGKALGASDLDATGDQYADFLATFRGPYDRVLQLMEVYGPLLKGHGPLLDIGSGRGELLEVAERAGIEASGIDLDVELVRQSVERGRTAVVGDGIEALREAAEASLGAVSAIHVVEHLAVDDLEAFFRQAQRALRPGGLLLSETINPHEVSAASTFWVDPTHRGPVFPEVALALALSTGFRSAHVFAPDGTGDWEHDRSRSTRYALVARR